MSRHADAANLHDETIARGRSHTPGAFEGRTGPPAHAGLLALQRSVGNRAVAAHVGTLQREPDVRFEPRANPTLPLSLIMDDQDDQTLHRVDSRIRALNRVKSNLSVRVKDAASLCDQSSFGVAAMVAADAAQAASAAVQLSPGLGGVAGQLANLQQACNMARTLDLRKVSDAAVKTRDSVRGLYGAIVAEMNAAQNPQPTQGPNSASGPTNPAPAPNFDALSEAADAVSDRAEQAVVSLDVDSDAPLAVVQLRVAKSRAAGMPKLASVGGPAVVAAAQAVSSAAAQAELLANTWVHKGKNLSTEFQSLLGEVSGLTLAPADPAPGQGADADPAAGPPAPPATPEEEPTL